MRGWAPCRKGGAAASGRLPLADLFPIRDRRGRTLGYGGRAMRSDQGAKYVNTAETDFFPRAACSTASTWPGRDRQGGQGGGGRGLPAVLALHQAGIEEAVGVMGTAITDEQIASLSGMVDEVILALDADSAGQEAMLRRNAWRPTEMTLNVATMPSGRGPC